MSEPKDHDVEFAVVSTAALVVGAIADMTPSQKAAAVKTVATGLLRLGGFLGRVAAGLEKEEASS